MRKWMCLLCCLVFCQQTASAYIAEQNFFVISGKDADLSEGDAYNRAVYRIAVPETYSGQVFIRIFDADLAGAHDRWEDGSEARYLVYGAGGIDESIRALTDPLPSQTPLTDLRLTQSRYYDDQWRTIAAPQVSEGELQGTYRVFQLIIDGQQGRATNKYQVFISALEKENTPIDGLKLSSPVVMPYLPKAPDMATELRFEIPEDAESLTVFNFDADSGQKNPSINVETQFNRDIKIAPSPDGKDISTIVPLSTEQRGQIGALVIRNPREANHIQFWITDDQGRTVPLLLPVFMGPENSLPSPEFQIIPLSECLSVMLDASGSFDPDNDDITFEWIFQDGTRAQGSRIVQNFEQAGEYDVTLVVSDQSGFVANSSKISKTIRINEPPTADIQVQDTAVPLEKLMFDASGSRDIDGKIRRYLWNFGDGSRAEGQTVEHAFARPGRYRVSLQVEDNSQSLCSQGKTAVMVWVNTPPVPRLNLPVIGAVDEEMTLDAYGSVDSDGTISRYDWDFGDGTTAEGEEVTHQWQAPGKYKVSLNVTDDAGQANSTTGEVKTIIINAPPVANIKTRDVIAAQEEVNFDGTPSSDSDGSISRYAWEMGDGATKDGKIVSHAYASPGTYTVKLTVTDNTETLNNSTSTTFQVRVNDPPVPVAGDDRIVNSSTVTFDAGASSDSDDPIIDYLWNFGDGATAHGQTVIHEYALPGTYTTTLTVTDDSATLSASQSTQIQVTVNSSPLADAGGPRIVSPGETVFLDGGLSKDPDGGILSYRWLLGKDTIQEETRAEYQFQQPGRYQAQLDVEDPQGAINRDYAEITVNAPPIAEFFPVTRMAPGDTVQFDGTSSYDADGSISRATWRFGDGSPDHEGLAVQHSYAEPGRYAVTLTVRDDSETSHNTDSKTRTIEINYPPVADAGGDIHTCSQLVAFDGSKSSDPDGDMLQYIWDFGDETGAEGRRVEHTYLKSGIYPVSLTVDDGHNLRNSRNKTTLTAYVNAPPQAHIQMNSNTVCAGELVLFDAGQSADLEKSRLRYFWNLGDENQIEGINPVRSYSDGGDYRIRLQVTDDSGLACNSDGAEAMLHVIDAPIADAGADQIVCANTLTQFDGSGSKGGGRQIKSYEWEFGDGQFGVGMTPAHVYARPGDYTARLVITVAGDGECSRFSEDEVHIQVTASPFATFQVNKAACPNEFLTFDATESGSSEGNITEFSWDFGDEATASGQTFEHAYRAPGEYRATMRILTNSAGDCNTAEYTETIRINSTPSPVIHITAGGKSIFNEERYETDLHTILRFSADESGDADGYIASYRWNFGDGQQQEGAFVEHQYEQAGDYTLTLSVQDNSGTLCDTNTMTVLVHVREPLIQEIQGDEMACTGEPFTYSVTADDVVEWLLNTGISGSGAQWQTTFDAPGIYQIQAKIGRDLMPTKTVTVFEMPDMRLPERIEVYPDDVVIIQPVYLRDPRVPLLFHWEAGDSTQVETERFSHAYSEPGEYTLQLTVTMQDGPECFNIARQIPVVVHTPPDVTIRYVPEQIFTGGARDEVLFEAIPQEGQTNWNYAWDFGDGHTAIGQKVSHTYTKSGRFTVTVTLSDALRRTSQTYGFSTQVEVVRRTQ